MSEHKLSLYTGAKYFFIIGLLSFQVNSSDVDDESSCEIWRHEKIMSARVNADTTKEAMSVSVGVSCLDDAHLSLNIVEGDLRVYIGNFFVPFSHSFELVDIGLSNRNILLFYVEVSEPRPVNSYYYAFIDFDQKKMLLSGYSDSPIELNNLDNKEGLEVIIGANITGISPLEFLIDYVPFPSIFSWGCSQELQIYDVSYFPEFLEKYRNDLIGYKTKLGEAEIMISTSRHQKIMRQEVSMIEMFLSRFQQGFNVGHRLDCL